MKSLYKMAMEDHLIKADVNYTVQDAIELATIERENEAACDAVEDSVEAVAMLTNRVAINSGLSADPAAVTEEMVQSSNECLAYCLGKLNVDSKTFEQIRVSRESASSPAERLEISTEGIGKIIKKVFKAIGDVLKWIWETIKKFFISIFRLFGFFKSKKKKKKEKMENTEKALNSVKKEVVEEVNKKVEETKDTKTPEVESQLQEQASSVSTNEPTLSDLKQVFEHFNNQLEKYWDFKNLSTDHLAEYVVLVSTIAEMLRKPSSNSSYSYLLPLCVNEAKPKVETIRELSKAISSTSYVNDVRLKCSKYRTLFDLGGEVADQMSTTQKDFLKEQLESFKHDLFSKFFYTAAFSKIGVKSSDDGVLVLTGIDINSHIAKFRWYTQPDRASDVVETIEDVDYVEHGHSKFVSYSDLVEGADYTYWKQIESAITFDLDTKTAEKKIKEMLDGLQKDYDYLHAKTSDSKNELNTRPIDPAEAAVWDKAMRDMNAFSKLIHAIQASTIGMMQYYKYSSDILELFCDIINVEARYNSIKKQFNTIN